MGKTNYTTQYLAHKIFELANQKRETARELKLKHNPEVKRELKKIIRILDKRIKQARELLQGTLEI